MGVANGPATVHSEYLLLTDIHIASERAIYGDLPHTTFGIAAGDGMQIVWEDLAGLARAKWLLWSGENIDAATAMQWGVVTEVLPHDKVLARGVEIATKLAARPPVYRQLQKETLNQRLIRRVAEAVPLRNGSRGTDDRRPRVPGLRALSIETSRSLDRARSGPWDCVEACGAKKWPNFTNEGIAYS